MKIVYPRDQFFAGVSLVSSICSGKTTKPILQNMKFVAKKEELQILGTDLEIAMRYKLPGDGVIEEGEAVVSATRLLNIIKETSGDTLELITDQRVCSITSKDAKFKLVGDDPEEFPNIHVFGDEGYTSIDPVLFNNYVSLTSFAAARDMGRYAFNGILIEIREAGIQCVATDGRRLAVAGKGTDSNPVVSSAIVPVKGLNQLSKGIVDEGKGELWIKIDDEKNQVVLKTSHVEVAAGKLEGEFPNYNDVIPEKGSNRTIIAREELLSALRKASITAGEESRSVRFSFKAGSLTVFSRFEGVGEAEVEVPVKYEGKPVEITYNPDFILDYIRVLDSDDLEINFKDKMSAGLFIGGEETVYVVMPITTKN